MKHTEIQNQIGDLFIKALGLAAFIKFREMPAVSRLTFDLVVKKSMKPKGKKSEGPTAGEIRLLCLILFCLNG